MRAKRITLPIMLVILFALLVLMIVSPALSTYLDPGEYGFRFVPIYGSVLSSFPDEVTYTSDSGVFFNYGNPGWRPMGIDEAGQLLVKIRAYKPDGSEISGESGYISEQRAGEEPPDNFFRIKLVFKASNPAALSDGRYTAVVEWTGTGKKIAEWNFIVRREQSSEKEYFDVFDGTQPLGRFETLAAARTFAQDETQKRKKELVIWSSRTGQVVEIVKYEPKMEAWQAAQPAQVRITGRQGRVALVSRVTKLEYNLTDLVPDFFIVTAKDSKFYIRQAMWDAVVGEKTTVLYIAAPLHSLIGMAKTQLKGVLEYPTISGETIVWDKLGYSLPRYKGSIIEQESTLPRFVLITGRVRLRSGGSTQELVVYTPVAAIRAEGTEFEVVATKDGETEVRVLDGRVSLSDLVKGKSITLKEGHTTRVTATSARAAGKKTTAVKTGVLAALPLWAWITIGAVTGVIITLLLLIVILLIVRRKPSATRS